MVTSREVSARRALSTTLPMEILYFLIRYTDSPSCSLGNVEEWVAHPLQEKRSKRAGSSVDATSRRDNASANYKQRFLWFLKVCKFLG